MSHIKPPNNDDPIETKADVDDGGDAPHRVNDGVLARRRGDGGGGSADDGMRALRWGLGLGLGVVGGLCFMMSSSQHKAADRLDGLQISSLSDVAQLLRVRKGAVSGSGEYVAVRGTVKSSNPIQLARGSGSAAIVERRKVLVEKVAKMEVPPAGGSSGSSTPASQLPNDAAVAPDRGRRTHWRDRSRGRHRGQSEPKLSMHTERTHLSTSRQTAPWLLDDGSNDHAMVDDSVGSVPLQSTGPAVTTSLEPSWGSRSATGRRRRDDDSATASVRQPVAHEVTERALKLGTLLTVVAHATLDSSGSIVLSGGVGPTMVTTGSLAALVSSHRTGGRLADGLGTVLCALGIGVLAYDAWKTYWR